MAYKYSLLPAQLEFMKIPHDEQSDIALYQGGYTCKKGDAEFLSPTGWRRIDTLTKEDLIGVYHPEDNTVKFEHPLEVFCWDADEWYEINTRTLHQINCPNHRMYTIKDGKPHIQSMKEFYEEHQNSSHGHRGKFVTTFKFDGDYKLDFSDDYLRLVVAYQADGTLYNNGEKYNSRFHFVKKRKVDRIVDLIKRNGFEYEIRTDINGDKYIYTYIKDQIKIFPKEWYNLNYHQLMVIYDECRFWDGTISSKHDSYYSSIKENADFIQFVGTVAGYRSTIFHRERNAIENRVNFNKNTTPSLYATRKKNEIKVYKAKKGEKKYCPSTSTKLWVCREFGNITITGNSGKTFCGSLISVLLCLKYDGIRGLIGAMTFPLVRDTTLVSFKEHLDNMGLVAGYHYTENISQAKITFYNGSEVLFRHLEEPDKLKSLNLGFVELEEMSDTPESTFLMLLSRLRQAKREGWDETAQLEGHKGFQYRLFGHTNPEPNKGWIYKNFVEKKQSNYRLILAPTTQNVFLPEGYIENMKNAYDPEYYRINVLGEFGDYTSGLVVKGFSDENIVDCEYVPELDIWLTCDFNVDPMCWYVAHVTHNNKVFFIDEFCVENTHTKQVADEFIRRYKDHRKHIWITGDASGDYRKTQSAITDYVIIRDTLRNYYGHNAVDVKKRPFNPPVRARIAAWNTMVKNSNGERKLFMNKKCEKLIYNCYNLKYKTGTSIVDVPTYSQIANDRNLKFLEHPFDAASYLVELLFPITTANKRLLSEYK